LAQATLAHVFKIGHAHAEPIKLFNTCP